MEKKISVVVPTYKRPELLRTCINALIRQDFPTAAYEIIIVSDGPDTGTEQFVQSFQKNSPVIIRFQALPENKGPAAARNAGWRQATAACIAFTDDDCIPDANWLKTLWDHFVLYPAPVAFAGRIVVPLSSSPTDFERNTARLEEAEFVTANCACSRTALEAVGGFDEAFRMAWREDSDLQFKFLLAGIPITRIQEAVVVHPVRKAPWGVSLKEQKKTMFNALLYKKYPSLYKEKIQTTPPWHYYVIVISFFLFLISETFHFNTLAYASFFSWLTLTLWFSAKRLQSTRRTILHIAEMVVTSILIPFISLYWRHYGSYKYKVLLW